MRLNRRFAVYRTCLTEVKSQDRGLLKASRSLGCNLLNNSSIDLLIGCVRENANEDEDEDVANAMNVSVGGNGYVIATGLVDGSENRSGHSFPQLCRMKMTMVAVVAGRKDDALSIVDVELL